MGAVVRLLEGLGGDRTSGGVLQQRDKIKAKFPTADVKVYGWSEWDKVAADFKAKPDAKHVLIGYSNGGSTVTWTADTGVRIDALVAEDPTVWLSNIPLKGNVKKALCIHNSNPFSSFPPVGHAYLAAGLGFDKTHLKTIETNDSHMYVDYDPVIIAAVFAFITPECQG